MFQSAIAYVEKYFPLLLKCSFVYVYAFCLGLDSQNQLSSLELEPKTCNQRLALSAGKHVTDAKRGKMHILLLIGWKRAKYVCSDWLDYFNQLESFEYTK